MIGRVISRYRVLDRLGSGGMGEVYRARDERLQRDVALKFLPGHVLADEAARTRFRKEALALSMLNHPNIATIYDFDTHDGVDFLVMECVAGETLGDRLRAGPLPESEIVRLGIQLAEALGAAHDRGVIHRDLKPGNVRLTPDARLKVLDFGLARITRPREVGETETMTGSGGPVGTLAYMAPEQLRDGRADVRTDIYSAGAVLYEMATGQQPVRGVSTPQLIDAVLHATPTPPRALNPQISPRLEAVMLKAMHRDPGRRYESARELCAELRRLEENASRGVSARGALGEERGRRLSRRVALLALAAAVVAGAVATLWSMRTKHQELGGPAAPTAARLSTGERASSNAEANEYYERAKLFLGSRVALPRAREMLERALELDPHFGAARAEYGFTHFLMLDAGYSNDVGWLYKAESELQRALADDPASGRVHSALAAVYLFEGRKELIPGEVEKSRRANPDDHDAANWLLNYHNLNGDYDTAESLATSLVARNPLFFPARLNLGAILRERGDAPGAIRELGKILEQDPENTYAEVELARAHMDRGELAPARQILMRASASDRRNYQMRFARALLLALEGKAAEALGEADPDALKYAEVNPYLPAMAAEVFAVLGDSPKALGWLDRAVRMGDERGEYFRRDPHFVGLRGEPRFTQILETIARRARARTSAN